MTWQRGKTGGIGSGKILKQSALDGSSHAAAKAKCLHSRREKWRAEARHGRQTGSVDKEGLMPGRAEAACLGRQQLPEQSSEQGPGRAGGWLPSVFRSTSLGNWAESVFYKEERQ